MTFYNKKIAKNKTLMKAWRAGHQIKSDEGEEICLPEICEEIGDWMRRHRHPRNRLSLRSFSILLSGTISLYRDQVNKLLSDTINYSWVRSQPLPRPILKTVNRDSLPSESSGESEEESFVLMPQVVKLKSSSDHSKVSKLSWVEAKSSEERNSNGSLSSDESTVFTVLSDDKQPEENYTPEVEVEKIEQAVQTEETSADGAGRHEGGARFNPDVPFAYVLIHDNYHSRIPSKIMFSSCNGDINLL